MHRGAMEAHALQAALVRQARGELDQPRPQLDGVVHRVTPDERRHDGREPAGARAHVEEGEAGPQLERLERARVDRRRREVHDAPRAQLRPEGTIRVAFSPLRSDAVGPTVDLGKCRLDNWAGERARLLQPLH